LVLSDFGIGGPALYPHRSEPEEWMGLVSDLRRQECDVIGLLPVPPDRWPRWLSTLMPLVCWDGKTTVGMVASSFAGTTGRRRPDDVISPARGAAELAVPLSIAVRIEPELIRAIRLAVLPYLDVAAESDLWFSDLVASRGPDSIVLKPEVLPGLRAQ